ncbi:MAG: carbohydrate ABC transporter permease [Lachnospiraceae bacterium]
MEMTSRKDDMNSRVVDWVASLLGGIVLVLTLYPLIYVLSASFSDPVSVTTGKVTLLPVQPTLDGYATIFQYGPIWLGYRNTLFYTIVGTLINMAVTLPCAYALSRRDFVGRNVLSIFFAFTMFFSGGLIPTYLVVKQLKMLNTVWALLLPTAMSVWNMIIARTYFQNSIPAGLEEAATIDGCSNLKLFFQIILPLSQPIIAVLILYYAVGHWNEYFNALIYLNDQNIYPLQLILRNILLLDQMFDMMDSDPEARQEMMRLLQMKESMKFGIIVLSTLPVMVLYPFLQKFFVKGVMIGAIKG